MSEGADTLTRMDRFPRSTLPPTEVEALLAPRPAPGEAPKSKCDLSSTCPTCGTVMQPEHAHYRCLTCGYRDSCCF